MKRIFVATVMMFATTAMVSTQVHASPSKASSTQIDNRGSRHDGRDDRQGHDKTTVVPSAVVMSFYSNFPSATNVEFQQENEHGAVFYKAKFYIGAERFVAFFDTNGMLLSYQPD
jgi:hypothetical protein